MKRKKEKFGSKIEKALSQDVLRHCSIAVCDGTLRNRFEQYGNPSLCERVGRYELKVIDISNIPNVNGPDFVTQR